jgi:DNA-directed RNA polymerase subunit RPC12/RpoP
MTGTEVSPAYCSVCGVELDENELNELECQRCRHHGQTQSS